MALLPNKEGTFGGDHGRSMITKLNQSQFMGQELGLKKVVTELENWFGPLQNNMPVDAYSSQPVTTYHLPDVFRGRSLFMGDTINGLVTSYNEWPTTLALPWMMTSEQHFSWTEFKFNHTLTGVVPPEGIPRLLTSSSTSFQRGTTRRGLAFLLEAEFYKSAQGQEMYRRNFRGIREAIQETANVGACLEIANAHDRYHAQNASSGSMPVTYATLAQIEANNFAIINKSDKGTDFLIGRIKDAMSQFKIRPDMMIVPLGFKRYYSMLEPERSQYVAWGPSGELQLREGPEIAGSIGGIRVVESQRRLIDEGAPSIDPFLETIRHGTVVPFIDDHGEVAREDFHSTDRDVIVWDETATKTVQIPFRKLLLYSFRFDAEGNLRPEHDQLASASFNELTAITSAGKLEMRAYDPKMIHRDMEKMIGERVSEYFRDMFLYRKDDNTFGVCHLFGMFEQLASTNVNFRVIAELAANKIFPGVAMSQARASLVRLKEIVHQSEQIPYTPQFYLALLRLNLRPGLSAVGTPADLAAHRGVPRIAEFPANEFGYLNMPAKTMDAAFTNWSVPPHLNSWPAFQTLIAMEGRQSGWDSVIEDLKRAVTAIKEIVERAKEVFGTSMFLNPVHRPPWFPKDDVETTIVHNLILRPRAGVFLRMPGNLGGDDADGNYVRSHVGDAAAAVDGAASSSSLSSSSSASSSNESFVNSIVNDDLKASLGVLAIHLEAEQAGAKDDLYSLIAHVATSTVPAEGYSESDLKTMVDRAARVGFFLCSLLPTKGVKTAAAKVKLFSAAVTPSDEVSAGTIVNAKAQIDRIMTHDRITMSRVAATGGGIETHGTYGPGLFDNGREYRREFENWQKAFPKNKKASGTVLAEGSKEVDNFDADLKDLQVGDVDFDRGFWLRIPMNSYKKFAESSLGIPRALAVPSDPDKNHLGPLAPGAILTAVLHESVATSITSLAETSLAEAAMQWEIPQHLYAAAGSTETAFGQKRSFDDDMFSGSRSSMSSAYADEDVNYYSSSSSGGGGGMKGFMSAVRGPQESARSSLGTFDARNSSLYEHPGAVDYYPKTGLLADATKINFPKAKQLSDLMEKERSFNFNFKETVEFLNSTQLTARWNFGMKISNPVVRILHQMFLVCRNFLPQWLDLYDNDINVPANGLAWRLWITRRMYQVPVMVGGFSTGATPYGNTDVQLSADGTSKVLMANVTFYMTSLIINPLQINSMRAAIANDYLYGHGTEFVMDESQVKWTMDEPEGDFIATLIPQTETELIEPLCLYGSTLAPSLQIRSMRRKERMLHYSSAPYYSLVFGLADKASELIMVEKEPRFGTDMRQYPQLMAYIDWHAKFNISKRSHSDVFRPVNSHLGVDGSGPYAAQALKGMDVKFTPADSLHLAAQLGH